MRNAHEGRQPVGVPHPPERPVDRVEDDFTDARVLEQHPLLARADVHRHQVAQGQVVVGVERRSTLRVVGERRHAVQHRALDVGKLALAAVAGVDRTDVLDHAGIAEGAVDGAVCLVEVHPRDRADGARRQRAVRRDRLGAHRVEVAPLEPALERDPVLPGLLQRKPEHALELVGIVALAAFVAPVPGDHLLRRVGVGEVA